MLASIPWMDIMKNRTLYMSFRNVSGMVSKHFCNCKIFAFFLTMLFLGCLTCYARNTVNPVNGKTMQDLYDDTVEKIMYLEDQGYNIEEMWECDLKKKLDEDEEMRRYFEEHDLVDPLQPRDAFLVVAQMQQSYSINAKTKRK